ncbi:MAG: twin-arginine translocase TatA/TatE family subunit [Halobacteriales archaeon]|nr:twin-arginine translocase TatA/TatE family subunit [Halobacteriales archaeon]
MVTPAITPLQFGVPGGMELAVILLIAVLLFGANKIPKLARSTGQAMGEFRRGREEIEQELEDITGEGEAALEPDETAPTPDDAAAEADDETDEEAK